MASPDKYVAAAQKRGATLTEGDEGWHGSFVHDGQEYTLDSDTIEELADDMDALINCLTEDDTYSLDYNDDTDRYIVEVEGFDEPFSDQSLAKAFAAAKGALMAKLAKAEEARKKTESPAKTRTKAAANGPEPGLAPQTGGLPTFPEAGPVAAAINDAVEAFRKTLFVLAGLPDRPIDPEPPTPAPPKRKRGIGKSA